MLFPRTRNVNDPKVLLRFCYNEKGAAISRNPLIYNRKVKLSTYRFENWKDLRALARPYFLRSTTRLSRVRKPCGFRTGRSAGS